MKTIKISDVDIEAQTNKSKEKSPAMDVMSEFKSVQSYHPPRKLLVNRKRLSEEEEEKKSCCDGFCSIF